MECIRDDFEEWRLCEHAWENIQTLIDKIGKVLTAEDRATIERRRIEILSEDIDFAYGSFNHFPQSDNVRGESRVSDNQFSFQDGPFPGIL